MQNIPRIVEVCEPILEILYSEKKVMHVREMIEPVCYYFMLPIPPLTSENMYGIPCYLKQPIVSRVFQAMYKLYHAGLVTRVSRGFYEISVQISPDRCEPFA